MDGNHAPSQIPERVRTCNRVMTVLDFFFNVPSDTRTNQICTIYTSHIGTLIIYSERSVYSNLVYIFPLSRVVSINSDQLGVESCVITFVSKHAIKILLDRIILRSFSFHRSYEYILFRKGNALPLGVFWNSRSREVKKSFW